VTGGGSLFKPVSFLFSFLLCLVLVSILFCADLPRLYDT
jgi:hypothetical protein